MEEYKLGRIFHNVITDCDDVWGQCTAEEKGNWDDEAKLLMVRFRDAMRIETKEDYEARLAEVEKLVKADPHWSTWQGGYLQILAAAVEKYEKEHIEI